MTVVYRKTEKMAEGKESLLSFVKHRRTDAESAKYV
jgi:hypothetical protein